MQNELKRKNKHFVKNLVIKNILSKTYVLDFSGSFDMQIEMAKKPIL